MSQNQPQKQTQAQSKIALVMAGGTGGHIFPGLAVAQALHAQGWQVHWVGAPNSMEERLVVPKGIPFERLNFGGLRGKGLLTKLLLPLKLLTAFWGAWRIIGRVKPNVLIGFGGYITFPAGMMGVLRGKALVLHEQNSIVGLANKVLAKLADRIFTAFPLVMDKGEYIGNPLRPEFTQQPSPQERYKNRAGVLNLLVVGGSLGATALNKVIPEALALIPEKARPKVLHQSGSTQIDMLKKNYEKAGVKAELTPFIENTAQAYAHADIVVARCGASTVTEIAAVGAPALFVPFPHAVDDHQTTNAQFLVEGDGAWLVQQKELTAEYLAAWLQQLTREELLGKAVNAYEKKQLNAVKHMVDACEELVKQ